MWMLSSERCFKASYRQDLRERIGKVGFQPKTEAFGHTLEPLIPYPRAHSPEGWTAGPYWTCGLVFVTFVRSLFRQNCRGSRNHYLVHNWSVSVKWRCLGQEVVKVRVKRIERMVHRGRLSAIFCQGIFMDLDLYRDMTVSYPWSR